MYSVIGPNLLDSLVIINKCKKELIKKKFIWGVNFMCEVLVTSTNE